jgi:hypothetical protein
LSAVRRTIDVGVPGAVVTPGFVYGVDMGVDLGNLLPEGLDPLFDHVRDL